MNLKWKGDPVPGPSLCVSVFNCHCPPLLVRGTACPLPPPRQSKRSAAFAFGVRVDPGPDGFQTSGRRSLYALFSSFARALHAINYVGIPVAAWSQTSGQLWSGRAETGARCPLALALARWLRARCATHASALQGLSASFPRASRNASGRAFCLRCTSACSLPLASRRP